MNNAREILCPFCHQLKTLIDSTSGKKKLLSCGHAFAFKKTYSQKNMDRKFVKTPYGLERVVKKDHQ